ncbi:NAD-dependent epimerase/dehydratase family protein [Oricola thermophila]|uniref:NAD-dependent epimerase/dehydratase family protein n=1 Tax=Oricola thermophila TaxID=2742145 RepID=A0A6N1VHZ3_9HYPH|nr:NAD-dependent epimerase/dehydratase family protein [Oricola thermophila]QKV18769.1 NAD-dependent epimerase/dehydratase family protein [Oricola thermophila]
MRILIMGGDGYLGWPTSMRFAAEGHEVLAVDNYLRRECSRETDSLPLFEVPDLLERAKLFKAETGYDIDAREVDLNDFEAFSALFEEFLPDAVVHYAEQPSAPYSMRGFDEARLTLNNNLNVTFNLIQAVLKHKPDCHIIKLGTMGEYGTPNIDIEEGWIDIEHKGRKDRFLFPRQAGSLYHTTKVLDTDLIWFYVRTFGLRATDLMQGPVYGLETSETSGNHQLYSFFNYDDIFGTVVNRFMVQAVAGVPLTVYGKGGQVRGYLDIRDTLQCIQLAAANPPEPGKLNIFNQFVETFSVNQLAERIKAVGDGMGLSVAVKSIDNPRKEMEEHYYNPAHTGLLDLGLKPHYLTDDVIAGMIELVLKYKNNIDEKRIFPRVAWKK